MISSSRWWRSCVWRVTISINMYFFFIMVSSFYDSKSGGSLNRPTHTPGILNCCFISVHSAPASGQTPVSLLNLSLFVSFPLFSCQTLSLILISPPLTLFPFSVYSCHWWNNNILKSKKGKSIIRYRNTPQNSKYHSFIKRTATNGQIIGESGKKTMMLVSSWMLLFFTTEEYE